MRKFNPDKELRKIQKGNKNKIILFVISLLIVGVMGYSFALYQVRYSKRIIYTKVAPFSNKDINILAIYLDDKPTDKFPEKGSKVAFDKVVCDNGSTGAFNTSTWKLILEAEGKDKCSVYFKTATNYIDDSGANSPELYQGLIPVTFDSNGNMKVADLTSDWYDYDDHRWANAVLVDNSNAEIKSTYFNEDGSLKTDIANKDIPMNYVLQMYVWIPRYKYQLFNAVNGESKPEQEIKIEFESGTLSTGDVTCEVSNIGVETCTNAENGNWYTHPAFKFGETQLKGIWIGKFESSDPTDNTGYATTIKEIAIVPSKISMTNKNIGVMFSASRKIEEEGNKYNLNPTEIDTHIMKNTDWGAVVYLSNSKYGIYNSDSGTCTITGCNVYLNNTTIGNNGGWRGTVTGCSATTADYNPSIQNISKCPSGRSWEKEGVKASTTGNMYGSYDMSGGGWEYVMSNMVNNNGNYYSSAAIFESPPQAKYYDIYQYGTSATDLIRGHLGDATRETIKTPGNATNGSWNSDRASFSYSANSWLTRGDCYNDGIAAGIFGYHSRTGVGEWGTSFRVALTAQDGNE